MSIRRDIFALECGYGDLRRQAGETPALLRKALLEFGGYKYVAKYVARSERRGGLFHAQITR